MVNCTKWKASTERETLCKRQRCGNTDTNTGEPTKVPVEDVRETESKKEVSAEQSTKKQISCEVSPSSSSPSTSQQNNGSAYSVNTSRANFEAKYLQLVKLGEDLVQFMLGREKLTIYQSEIGGQKIPMEVLLMLRVDPSRWNIMKHLVEAAIKMHSDGVFHRDIKIQNALVETCSEVPRVWIIDFGCGCFMTKTFYRRYSGTSDYAPPEFYINRTYKAGPTTVWQLGALLYETLDGYKEFTTFKVLSNEIAFNGELSQDCQDLLRACLDVKPRKHATLEQMQKHPWFT